MDIIYLNGGEGKRIELGYPKQFARLNGIPILIYGLKTLNQLKEINKIYIPTAINSWDITKSLLVKYHIQNWELVEGGETRQESVFKALQKVKSEYVLICESVRPFMSKELIIKVINDSADCVAPIDRSIATVINTYGECYNRDTIGAVQMPQKYNTKKLLTAYNYLISIKNNELNYSDDFELVKDYEIEALTNSYTCYEKFSKSIFHGNLNNIKITYPIDITIAEAIIKEIKDE
jgi:2-C-methyl-D-erythritol 4-phosphate cytidylyltransferase